MQGLVVRRAPSTHHRSLMDQRLRVEIHLLFKISVCSAHFKEIKILILSEKEFYNYLASIYIFLPIYINYVLRGFGVLGSNT
jgi:hypothetical protein